MDHLLLLGGEGTGLAEGETVVEVEGEVVPVGKDVVAVVLADLLDDSVGVGLGNGGEHLLTKEGAEEEGVGLVLGVLDLVANGLDVLGCGATENNCVQMSHALVLGTELLGQTDILLENLSLGENNRDVVDSLLIEDENSKSFGIRKTCEHVFDVLLEGSVHVANGDLRSHLSKD